MIRCPRTGCLAPHAWTMTANTAHVSTMDALHRAAEMREEEAVAYLGVVLLRISLELRGWCANCVLTAQGDVNAAIVVENRKAVPDTREPEGRPLGRLIMFRAPPRDAAHLDKTFDTERKP